MNEFERIQRMAASGDISRARHDLGKYLQLHPMDSKAWWLLVTLVDDLEHKADCYRRIIALEPTNRDAVEKLAAIMQVQQDGTQLVDTPIEADQVLRCPTCGGELETHFLGELKDKRAVCAYCGTQVDLPDSYRRVSKLREEQRRLGGSTTVETTLVETRANPGEALGGLPPDVSAMLGQLQETDPEGEQVYAVQRTRNLIKVHPEDAADPADVLRIEDQIHLLKAVPAGKRAACPHCKAVVSVEDTRCQWCGKPIEELSVEKNTCHKCEGPLRPTDTECLWCGEPVRG